MQSRDVCEPAAGGQAFVDGDVACAERGDHQQRDGGQAAATDPSLEANRGDAQGGQPKRLIARAIGGGWLDQLRHVDPGAILRRDQDLLQSSTEAGIPVDRQRRLGVARDRLHSEVLIADQERIVLVRRKFGDVPAAG